jgi:C4-dicarboxylate-specific signal transduction histidine kinase
MSRFNRPLWAKPLWIWRYGFAFLSTTSAVIISAWLTPHIGFPGTLFIGVVMVSGWLGGVGPGLLATTISTLAFHYTFLHSKFWMGQKPPEMPRLFMFFIANLFIALVSAAQRNAKESLRRTRDDLQRTVHDLQITNEALHVESRERKQAEDALRQAHADLARANRVTSMGELAASLAHEVNQPIAAAVTNASTCLRWLSRDQPNLDEARAAASRIVQDGKRASEIVKRVRQLFKKDTLQRELVDINEVIREMILLLRSETIQFAILVRVELATDLPDFMGDRVQLQQVLMNLMTNSIDAMKDVDGTRELTIQSQRGEDGQLLISVSDTGVGLPSQQADKIFNSFFTTKTQGTGMGLSISRSIVESHGGRLWAGANSPRGANFYFTLSANAQVPQ